jgi:hypothetical protein
MKGVQPSCEYRQWSTRNERRLTGDLCSITKTLAQSDQHFVSLPMKICRSDMTSIDRVSSSTAGSMSDSKR